LSRPLGHAAEGKCFFLVLHLHNVGMECTTHSSWLSTSQENEGSGCRERYYRLRAPARQLWSDKLNRFFRGQSPRTAASRSWQTHRSTLSAQSRRVGGSVIPSACAVFRLR